MTPAQTIEEIGLRKFLDQLPANELGPVIVRNMVAERWTRLGIENGDRLAGRPDIEYRLRDGDRFLGCGEFALLGEQNRPIFKRIVEGQFDDGCASALERAVFAVNVGQEAVGSGAVAWIDLGRFEPFRHRVSGEFSDSLQKPLIRR